MTIEEFRYKLENTIDASYAEIVATKEEGKKFLSYPDAKIITGRVRNIFSNRLALVPPQIEAACKMSEAFLAPSGKETKNLIKAALGIGGGTAGIAMVIGGIGTALGWGAGVVASVTAWFVGSSIAGPAGWIAAGVAVAAIAGYFSLSGDDSSDTERFLKVLKNSVGEALPSVVDQYENRILADE